MKKIHWGFLSIGILTALVFIIVFFQNLNPLFYATWSFLFLPQMQTNSGMVTFFGFLGGFFTAFFVLISVRGGRYDPNIEGKDQPDAWERIADQY